MTAAFPASESTLDTGSTSAVNPASSSAVPIACATSPVEPLRVAYAIRTGADMAHLQLARLCASWEDWSCAGGHTGLCLPSSARYQASCSVNGCRAALKSRIPWLDFSTLLRDLTAKSLHSNHGLVYLNRGQSEA